MKVSQAKISFTLNGRLNQKGEQPVIINIAYHGRIRRFTNISVKPSLWEHSTQRIKLTHPLAKEYNKILDGLEQSVKQRQAEFIEREIPYTPVMLWEKRDTQTQSLYIKDIIDNYIIENNLKWSSQTRYTYLYSLLSKFFMKGNILITELTELNCKKFGRWLKDNNKCDGTINQMLSKIAALYNYCIRQQLVPPQNYPFWNFKYVRTYKRSIKNKALSKQQMEALEGYWVNNFLYVDPESGEWTYKPHIYEKLQTRTSKETALTMFLIMFRFQGLAVADLARLKISDFRKETHTITNKDGEQKDREYYVFNDIQRRKTGEIVKIVLEDDNITGALLLPYINTASKRDDYLFPLFQNDKKLYKYSTEKDYTNALITVNGYLNKGLKEIIKEYNKANPQIPISEDTTFYCARHTFATAYMTSKGANPLYLAKLMGRNKAGIFDYIADLQRTQDIAQERARMGISY